MKTWIRQIESEWEVGILRGERLRSLLLLSVLGLFLLANLSVHLFFPKVLDALFSRHFPTLASFLGSSLFFMYEVGFFLVLSWNIRRRQRLPKIAAYLNAILETTVPTIAMSVAATAFSPQSLPDSPFYLVYFLFIILSAMRMKVSLTLVTSAVAAAEYLFLGAWFAVPGSGTLALEFLKVVMLLVAGVLTAVVTHQNRSGFLQAWKNSEDKNRVIGLFGQQVSPAVVQKLLNQPQENLGENLPVTVLFLDIRNFTAFSEKRSPEEVVHFLNGLFDFMIDIVNKNHGIINKFLGDGFMAVFGAPLPEGNSQQNALKAAIELRGELSSRIARGEIPPTRIGIGIHCGTAVTGNVGSPQRREYTVIGNVVNTASRLESLNKEMGTNLLVSDEVWHAGAWDGLLGKPRGQTLLRGQEAPLNVWEVVE
ncbi:MAG: adenylate/guanylate cyclase domain-containing protein [Spirochaetales bacterium]|nr:adenylate/guanylate cyclase domain-containing protein [Spirochaetales bacterium]